MVFLVLFIVCMALWFLMNFPAAQATPFGWTAGWLPFFAVLILGLYIFMPGLR